MALTIPVLKLSGKPHEDLENEMNEEIKGILSCALQRLPAYYNPQLVAS